MSLVLLPFSAELVAQELPFTKENSSNEKDSIIRCYTGGFQLKTNNHRPD